MRVVDGLVRLARWALWLVVAALGVTVAVAGLGQRAPQPPPAASGSWATPEELGDFIAERAADLRLAGLAVVVLRDGDVYEESYLGTAGAGRPVTADTPFVLGSTSKQFTGLAVQRLIADGRLALDTTVAEVLPDVEADGDVGHMSVRQLLTHTSGLTTTTGLEQWGWMPGRSPSIADNAHALTSAAAGAQGSYEYSNSNYDLLGAIVEEVTAQPFAAAVEELVLGPLRLAQTTAGPDSATLDDVAVGYHSWLEVVTVPTPCPCTPGAVPSAFMVSTAADLTQLLRAHMGSVPTELPDEVLATAREPLTTIDPYSQYGSGWVVRPLWEQLVSVGDPVDGADLPSCVEHLGSTYRSQSYLMACPSLGFGIATLTNTGAGIDTTRWSRFQTDLTHLALGTPTPAPGFNPVESNAPVIIPGLLLAQALSLLPLTAARSGTWRVALALGGAIVGPVLWWGYAPTRLGPRLPVASLWAQAPELGIATLVSTALALVAAALAATWAAWRRHGPARRN